MKVFKRFLLYLLIGIVCTLIPALHLSVILGFPAVLLNSIILTFIYANDNKELE